MVVDEATLQARVRELGAQITADYAGRSPLLIGVLKGAAMFMSDLSRAIALPLEIDFMAVSSYGNATRTSGVVRIVKDLDIDLTGRHVVIVEDIVDSGLTLSYLRRTLAARGAASLEVCALLRARGPPEDRRGAPLRGLPDPAQVRGRIRARLRREVPEPPVCLRVRGRRVTGLAVAAAEAPGSLLAS